MNKYITFTIISWIAVTSNTSLSMLRLLPTQTPPHARMCHTKNTFFTLPEKTIFNASEKEISINAPTLLEDLYDRNNNIAEHLLKEIECAQKIMKNLQHQNAIAINHTYHEEPLNLIKLQSLENTLKKNLEELFKMSLSIHRYTFENKVKNRANE